MAAPTNGHTLVMTLIKKAALASLRAPQTAASATSQVSQAKEDDREIRSLNTKPPSSVGCDTCAAERTVAHCSPQIFHPLVRGNYHKLRPDSVKSDSGMKLRRWNAAAVRRNINHIRDGLTEAAPPMFS